MLPTRSGPVAQAGGALVGDVGESLPWMGMRVRTVTVLLVLCGCVSRQSAPSAHPEQFEQRSIYDHGAWTGAPIKGQASEKAGDPAQPEPSAPPSVGVLGCPDVFAVSLRGRWHEVRGQRYFIDALGRPTGAVASIPPVFADDPRNDACQLTVGRLGDHADPGEDYDGGHLVGYELGGWSGRANMVPQNASFNRGNWLQLERAVAGCRTLPAGRIEYEVTVRYPSVSSLVPREFEARLRNTATGQTLRLRFKNAKKGGPQGLVLQRQARKWLRAMGCR